MCKNFELEDLDDYELIQRIGSLATQKADNVANVLWKRVYWRLADACDHLELMMKRSMDPQPKLPTLGDN